MMSFYYFFLWLIMVPVCMQHIFICSDIAVVAPCLNISFFFCVIGVYSICGCILAWSMEVFCTKENQYGIVICTRQLPLSLLHMIFWTGIKMTYMKRKANNTIISPPKLSAFYLLCYPSLIQELFCCLELLYVCLSEFSCRCAYRFNITLIFYK